MPEYKVLKDFPSRNGAKEYKTGRIIELNKSTRTRTLIAMGYIKEAERETDPTFKIAWAIKNHVKGAERVKVQRYYPAESFDGQCYLVEIYGK